MVSFMGSPRCHALDAPPEIMTVSPPISSGPDRDTRRLGRLPRFIGQLWLAVSGWRLVGEPPRFRKCVLIGAPHTSAWDFPFALAMAAVAGIRMKWMGKDSLFRGPLGWLMRSLGGIPIDRSHPHGLVGQLAELMRQAEDLAVAITPSGTRMRSDYWKSGFYWIAMEAQVPVVCGFICYRTRRVGFGYSFVPTGDVKKDMEGVREFYREFAGRNPEQTSLVRLADENGAGGMAPPEVSPARGPRMGDN